MKITAPSSDHTDERSVRSFVHSDTTTRACVTR